jgi:hypothetical protein
MTNLWNSLHIFGWSMLHCGGASARLRMAPFERLTRIDRLPLERPVKKSPSQNLH